MKLTFQRSLVLACAFSLAACGGGGDSYIGGIGDTGGTTGGGTTTTTSAVKQLEVAASSRELGTSGDSPVTISAVAKDANNNAIKGVSMQFSVNNSATIEQGTAVSGSVQTAVLTPGLDNYENRTVTVTVTAGGLVKKLDVAVSGTTLQLDGASRIVQNKSSVYTAKLKDSAGDGLAYHTVLFSSSAGNIISPVSGGDFTTNAKGEVQFSLLASAAGTDTLTATALGASFSKTVEVSGDDFSLSSPNAEITVNTAETVSLLWKHNGVAQANKAISLSATRGTVPAQVQTDAQGKASFTIQSATAGGTVVTATDIASGLSASLVKEFVAIAPNYLNMQSEQSTVAPEGSVTIVTLVRDVHDNPVKNQSVAFNLNDTVNGSLSSSLATTDSLGRATVVYTAGNASSAKNGVVIQSYLTAKPTIKDSIALTVGSRALRLVLGHDENLKEEDVYYKQTFGVIVTDSNGNAISGKRVDFSIIPIGYVKGDMGCSDTGGWGLISSTFCPTEDQDHDGWLDDGEDFNSNGLLEPTHVASITPNAVTDEDGKVSVDITYLQSEAMWNVVRLTATIVDAGTEFMESTEFTLGVVASDMGSCDIAPPNQFGPYGSVTDCVSPY